MIISKFWEGVINDKSNFLKKHGLRLFLLIFVFALGFGAVSLSQENTKARPAMFRPVIVKKEADGADPEEEFKFKVRTAGDIAFGVKTPTDYTHDEFTFEGSSYSGEVSILYGFNYREPNYSMRVGVEDLYRNISSPMPQKYREGSFGTSNLSGLFLMKNEWSCSAEGVCPEALNGQGILYYYFYDTQVTNEEIYPFEIIDGELYDSSVTPKNKLNIGEDYITFDNESFFIKIADGVENDIFEKYIRNLTGLNYRGENYTVNIREDSYYEELQAFAIIPTYQHKDRDNDEIKYIDIESGRAETCVRGEDYACEFTLKNGESKMLELVEGRPFEIWEELNESWELVDIDGSDRQDKVEDFVVRFGQSIPEYIFVNKKVKPEPESDMSPELNPEPGSGEGEKKVVLPVDNPQTGDRKILPLTIMAGSAIVLLISIYVLRHRYV